MSTNRHTAAGEGGVQEGNMPVGVSPACLGDADAYEPPALRRLGSLAELTQGGTSGPSDGFGGAGAMGSI